MKNLNKSMIIYIWLLIQPFIDLLISFTVRFTQNFVTVGIILRGLFLLIILFMSILKNKNNKKLNLYYLVLILYFISYLVIRIIDNGMSVNLLANEIKYIFKYFYYPLLVVSLISLKDYLKLDNSKIIKILIFNLFFISFSILVSQLTNTAFDSYSNNNYGIVGWFYSANEIGAIIIILYLFSLSYNDGKLKYFYLITSIITILASIYIGTKTVFFGIVLSLISYLTYVVYFLSSKIQKRYLLSRVFVILFLLLFVAILGFNSPVSKNIENVKTQYEDEISQKSNTILDKLILSSRLEFLKIDYNIYSSSNLTKKFWGIGFTGEKKYKYPYEKRSEMDLFDIFLRFGIFGFLLYFIPLILNFIRLSERVIKEKFINENSSFCLYSFVIGNAVAFIAGHVMSSPGVSIYLVFCLFIVSNNNTELYLDNPYNQNKARKKITIMALHLGYGGVEQYISSLCKMLEKDYDIEIISTYKVSEKPAFNFSKNIKIKYLINSKPNKVELKKAISSKKIPSIIRESFKSIKILYKKRIYNIRAIKLIDSDYIITTRFHSSLVGKYANKNSIKIATEHNFHNNNLKYIKSIIKSVNNFDCLVCVSEELKDFYKDKIGKTKCVFIPNVIDSIPKKSSKLEGNGLIYVGRLEPEKAPLELIEVFNDVSKKINGLKLYIIGDGSLREEMERRVHKYKLNDNVLFTGFVSKKEIEKYMLKSKLYIMTSITESFGLVLIEAMSYKLPCVAYSSANGAKELLSNNNGILVDNRDHKKMVNAIVNILSNENKLRKISENGYAYCKKYLISNVKEEWTNLLDKLQNNLEVNNSEEKIDVL